MIGQRIEECILALGIKKKDFAEKLNVSSSFVTQMVKGISSPSDRTIIDICQKFNVNEEWLRYGNGEMFLKLTKNEEISIFFETVMNDDDKTFRKQVVDMLSQLDEQEWLLLEKIALKISHRDTTEQENNQ